MASRRNVSHEEGSFDDSNAGAISPSSSAKSNVAPAVPASVIYKLLGFTFAMITLPIGSYFLTVDSLFKGNSTFAGATAAVVANVVLIAYVITAMKEDQSDRLEAEQKAKKTK